MNLKQAYKILEENKKTYNEISDEFNQTRRKYDSGLEDLKKYIIPNEKILDLGCGNGRLYEFFSAQGRPASGWSNVDYTGIDYSKNLIQIAEEKYGNHFQVADILSLPFSSQYFDSIWSIAVLHHIPSRELRKRALDEIKRVLRPDGRVIMLCWNLYQSRFFKLLLKLFLSKDIFVPFHGKRRYYHAFTKRELRKLFKKSGFKIEELRYLKRNNKKVNILVVAKKL